MWGRMGFLWGRRAFLVEGGPETGWATQSSLLSPLMPKPLGPCHAHSWVSGPFSETQVVK